LSRGPIAATGSLVRVDGISKAFRNGNGETPVLKDLSLQLTRGETTSLIGASGSGKSTLLSLIAGLMSPDSGEIVFDGVEITGLEDSARARLRARRIGIVLQSGNLIPFLTAVENVELALLLAGGSRPAIRARELLGEIGLRHRLDQVPRRLSGGEAQRVAVAMALANEPDLLLADEATGELDQATAEQVTGVIFEECRDRGLTVLLMTHSSQLAERAQRQLHLEDGRVKPT
jgi:putative ABC transport system ATP-binding protein